MNKLIKKLSCLAFGLVLSLGVGVSLTSNDIRKEIVGVRAADESLAYTLTPSNGKNNSYASSEDITISGIQWNATGNISLTPWRIGGKNLSSTNRYVYSKNFISGNISKVELTIAKPTKDAITVNSIILTVHSNATNSANGEADSSCVSKVKILDPTINTTNTTFTFTKPDGENWKDKFYSFTFSVTNSSSSNNKYVCFIEAKFYNTVSSDPDLTFAANITSTPNVNGLLIGETYKADFEIVNGNVISNPLLTFSSTNSNVTFNKVDDGTGLKGQVEFTMPAKLDSDSSIDITATLTSQSDASFNIQKTLSYKCLVPVLKFNVDSISMRRNKEAILTITSLENFGSNPSISVEFYDGSIASATTNIADEIITFKGLAVGNDIAEITVQSATGKQTIVKEINIEVTDLDLTKGYFTKITSLDDLSSGSFLLIGEKNSTSYVFDGTYQSTVTQTVSAEDGIITCDGIADAVRINLIPTRTTNTSLAKYFYIQIDSSRVSDTTSDSYKNNGKYLGATESKSLGIDTDQKEHVFTASDDVITATYNTSWKLCYNGNSSTSRFSYYLNNQGAINLYKYVPATAKQYAEEFKTILSNPCSDENANNIEKINAVWSDLEAKFNGLDDNNQLILMGDDSTDAIVVEALKKYDHIVKKYGVNNFIGRDGLTSNRNINTYNNNNNIAIMSIVIISFVGITIIGGYLFLKKQKQN